MPRFFTEEIFPEDQPSVIRLTGDNAFHLTRVLRARPGESVTVVAGDGKTYSCRFLSSSPDGTGAELEVISASRAVTPSCRVTLVQGMPKGKKTDLILQKATELGADRIVFVYMDRSVPVAGESQDKKLSRFRRIAEEAASQSARDSIPTVLIRSSLEEAMPLLAENEIAFACYEAEETHLLPDTLGREGASIGFLIGPEGGVSPREISLLEKAGIPTVSLGRRILRTETAPLAVLSMIMYEKELRK